MYGLKDNDYSIGIESGILSMLNVLIWMELWFVAETSISASLTSIIIYTYPIISTLNEIPSFYELIGLILVGIGIFFSARGTMNRNNGKPIAQ